MSFPPTNPWFELLNLSIIFSSFDPGAQQKSKMQSSYYIFNK